MSSLYRAAAALALALGACACRSATHARNASPDLAYEIRAPRPDDPCVRLTLRARASLEGETLLEHAGDWGGSEDSSADLVDLAAQGADGRELALEPCGRGRWRVAARPLEPLRVSWGVARNQNLASATHQDHYRAALTGELFHAIGNHLFLAPAELAGGAPLRIALSWTGFEELGWTTACSFGTGAELRLERPLSEFRQAVFLAGEYRLHERSVNGRRLVVALPARGLRIDGEGFADLAARVVAGERAFFDDWDYPFYLISVVPTGREDARASSLGGAGLTDSFALFLQRGSDLSPGSPLHESVVAVLAHEMFHNWCGRWTPLAEPEQLCYWFSEGFTEFFTRRLLLRLGLIDRERYAARLQQSLHDYLANPRRNCSNQAVVEGFWKERETGEIPYRRGDLVAARLDHAIRVRTGGARSLDDFVREAVRLGRQGEPLTVEALLARIERWTDAELARELAAVVVEGATLELPRELFAPCLLIEPAEVPCYELGFDFDASRKAKAITGLVPGSAAERAGLAEGQPLAGFIDQKRADRPARVEVLVDGQRRTIEYLPQGKGELLPCVLVASEQGCEVL